MQKNLTYWIPQNVEPKNEIAHGTRSNLDIFHISMMTYSQLVKYLKGAILI